LEVVGEGFAAAGPGDDVVALHLREFEVVAADGAEAVLAFVGGFFLGVAEGAEVEEAPHVWGFAGEEKFPDARFLMDFVVLEEGGGLGIRR
jgi:hypothetical protein